MPGAKKVVGRSELVGMRFPKAVYDEMLVIISSDDRWPYPARQNFILEAVKEKVERWKRDHPLGAPSRRDGGR